MGSTDTDGSAKDGGYPLLNFGAKPKHIKNILLGRLDQFMGSHYHDVSLPALMYEARVDDDAHVQLEVWHAPGLSKPTFEEARKARYEKARKGETRFGPSWSNHWIRVTLKVPDKDVFQRAERVQFEFDPGCEAMVFTTGGLPLQGITGGDGGDRRVEYILDAKARKGKHTFYIEISANGMFGLTKGIGPPDMNRFFTLASADIVVPRMAAWHLFWDFTTIKQIARTLPDNSPLNNKAMWVGNEIMNTFRQNDVSSIDRGRKLAEEILGEGWAAKGEKIYDGEERKKVQLWSIGNCHIDTAWLWTYSQTQQKIARSWSTQLDLIERYPEHRFVASQAQQFKWLEELYPQLFQKVKAKVEQGTFIPIGGTWVEMDCNMPSGEALARQFLYGQRFFESRFGQRCRTFWLPDTFGYSSQLPQLVRSAGMTYFFTQKLSWNNINDFPHSTFNWVGLDESQVLTHMTPVDTYTAQATIEDVWKGVHSHKNLDVTSSALLAFGNGDGGGGPLAAMLENLRRIRAVAAEHREMPVQQMGQGVNEFFDHVLKETKNGSRLPTWSGELYLELHRGTYTSHGSIKKGNRKSEILLQTVEYVATLAALKNQTYRYPKKTLDECWEKVLLNQFHDILPGSAIEMAYVDAEKLYAEVFSALSDLLDEAHKALLPESSNVDGDGEPFALNMFPVPRREVVELPFAPASKRGYQASADGKKSFVVMDDLDASGFALPKETPDVGVTVKSKGKDEHLLTNGNLRVHIAGGRIPSIFDVQDNRELIPQGRSAGLVLLRDQPNYWDAWDTEYFSLEEYDQLTFDYVEIVEKGPTRGQLLARTSVGKSQVNLYITLDAVTASPTSDSRSLLRFDADVDWREQHKFLKFELPLNLRASEAQYETQFGVLTRPTTRNTNWEAAKFEVCAHKAADLSESGYGVAIVNDCKYGYAIEGNTMRLSLLRSSTEPDAHQDQGKHTFSFAIYPHLRHFFESDVIQVARAFNVPLLPRRAPASSFGDFRSSLRAPFSVSGAKSVFLDTVKRGEDDDFRRPGVDDARPKTQTVILRLYEAYGGHAKATLHIGTRIKRASYTNILEDAIEEVPLPDAGPYSSTAIPLTFRGFEVKTLRLVLAADGVKRRSSREWVKVEKDHAEGA